VFVVCVCVGVPVEDLERDVSENVDGEEEDSPEKTVHETEKEKARLKGKHVVFVVEDPPYLKPFQTG
jgi:hypothetical protein